MNKYTDEEMAFKPYFYVEQYSKKIFYESDIYQHFDMSKKKG